MPEQHDSKQAQDAVGALSVLSVHPESNLVAVYGSLRKGLGNHRLIHDLEPVSVEKLSGFDMYSMGAFPCVYHGNGEITVEVYDVTQERLEGPLDTLEGHPVFYRREPVQTSQGPAWVYVMVSESYRVPMNLIHSGDWFEFKTKGDLAEKQRSNV